MLESLAVRTKVVLVLVVVARGPACGRRHHVAELADLRGALQHLHRVRVARDLERRGGEDAQAAERARLEARHARLEVGDGRRAALLEPVTTQSMVRLLQVTLIDVCRPFVSVYKLGCLKIWPVVGFLLIFKSCDEPGV